VLLVFVVAVLPAPDESSVPAATATAKVAVWRDCDEPWAACPEDWAVELAF
jgi:hypothetical protein